MNNHIEQTTDETVNKNPTLGPRIKNSWLRAFLFTCSALFAMILSAIFAIIIIAIVAPMDIAILEKNDKDLMMVIGPLRTMIFFMNQVIGVMLATWFYIAFIDRSSFRSFGFQFKSFEKDFIIGSVLGGAFIISGFLLLMAGGFLTIASVQFPGYDFIMYFLLFVFVALNEEILCRSYLLSTLMHATNRYVALLITSILFTIMHLTNANLNLIGTINLFLAGLLLGIYYVHKRNLWFSVGMHITWNFFQGPICGFAVSGNSTPSIITQEIKGNEMINGGKFGFESSILATLFIIGLIIFIHMKYRNAGGSSNEA